MLDESMFEDIHEIAENNAYLKAVEDKDVSLEMLDSLPPYDQCKHIEQSLRDDGHLTFDAIFHSPTGFYLFSCFLLSDYSVDKAIFLKDVEGYRRMRFESARKRIALAIYHRFVSQQAHEQREWIRLLDQYTQQLASAQQRPLTDNQIATISVFTVAQKAGESNISNLTTTTTATPSNIMYQSTLDGSSIQMVQSRAQNFSGVTLASHKMNSVVPINEPSLHIPSHSHPSSSSSPHTRTVISINHATATTLSLQHNSSFRDQHTTKADHNTINVPSINSQSRDPHHSHITDEDSVEHSHNHHAGLSFLSVGHENNSIGVYGKSVALVRSRVYSGSAPVELFDKLAHEVYVDLKLDAFPRFLQSVHFERFIRTKFIETQRVHVKDFTTFRVLGRGGFGAVHACRKKNSGAILAMKAINKKLVKVKSALDNVLEERNVLTMMKSSFVTNLKYALQDEDSLYLIMDLMLGGDLKFHLINAGRFTEKRARFYAAQVLLGLESVHRMSIIYRDMKLENVLLDERGHCKMSDLGLAVVTKVKIKGYAGTPGYTAPEMIKNKLYGPAADIFSYGVMLYRMLCGSKPFKGKIDRELDKAVLEKKPSLPKELFSKDASSLLTGLLQKKPEARIGCSESPSSPIISSTTTTISPPPTGMAEIKAHPFFESIDWGLLEAGYVDPPFVPNKFDVNAASLKDIGDFDRTKYKHVKLDDRFKQRIKNFDWTNVAALQTEMVAVLEKADAQTNFEKFAPKVKISMNASSTNAATACCVLN